MAFKSLFVWGRWYYLACLEAMTANGNPDPYVSLFFRLARFSSELPCANWDAIVAALEKSGALKDAPAASLNLASTLL